MVQTTFCCVVQITCCCVLQAIFCCEKTRFLAGDLSTVSGLTKHVIALLGASDHILMRFKLISFHTAGDLSTVGGLTKHVLRAEFGTFDVIGGLNLLIRKGL